MALRALVFLKPRQKLLVVDFPSSVYSSRRRKSPASRSLRGNGVLAAGQKDISDGGAKDLVAYDDFFYSEPVSNN